MKTVDIQYQQAEPSLAPQLGDTAAVMFNLLMFKAQAEYRSMRDGEPAAGNKQPAGYVDDYR